MFPLLPLCLVAVATAAAPAKDSAPGPAARLRQALDETGDAVFENKSLVEVAAYFKGKFKAEVRFDAAAVMGQGVDPNAPVITSKVRDGKLRDGLKAALAATNLSFGVVGGALVIGPEEAVIQQQMRQRVSLDGEATTLSAVLKALADETGANIALDPRVEEKAKAAAVKLKLADVPLETAVRLAVDVAGYATVRMSNVLFVTSEERAEKLKAVADPPAAATAVTPAFPALPPRAGDPPPVAPR